jgi:hypothetical protein
VTPWISETARRFGGIYIVTACFCFFLFGLIFNPESEDDVFLRNIGLWSNDKALQPTHRCENFRSNGLNHLLGEPV